MATMLASNLDLSLDYLGPVNHITGGQHYRDSCILIIVWRKPEGSLSISKDIMK